MRTSRLLMAAVLSAVMLASSTSRAQESDVVVNDEPTAIQLAKALGMDSMNTEDWAAIFILSSVFVVALSFAVSRVIRATRSTSVPDDLYDQLAGLEQRLALLEDRAMSDGKPEAAEKVVEFSPPR